MFLARRGGRREPALCSSRRRRKKRALFRWWHSLFLDVTWLDGPIETCTRRRTDNPKPFQQVLARPCARAGGGGGSARFFAGGARSFSTLHDSMALSRRVLDDEPIIPNPSSKCSLGCVLEQEEEQEGLVRLPVKHARSLQLQADLARRLQSSAGEPEALATRESGQPARETMDGTTAFCTDTDARSTSTSSCSSSHPSPAALRLLRPRAQPPARRQPGSGTARSQAGQSP